MFFPLPNLINAIFLYRYKRFLAKILINDIEHTVYCPNTGSLYGLLKKNIPILIKPTQTKYNFRWILAQTTNTFTSSKVWVNIDTSIPNQLIHFFLQNKKLPPFQYYQTIKREVFFSDSRIDFLLTNHIYDEPDLFLEVKQVTLNRKKNIAEFPDSVTKRGTKHLQDLQQASQKGFRAAILYVICRGDCNVFSIAKDIDPKYYNTYKKVSQNIQYYHVYFDVSPKGFTLKKCI